MVVLVVVNWVEGGCGVELLERRGRSLMFDPWRGRPWDNGRVLWGRSSIGLWQPWHPVRRATAHDRSNTRTKGFLGWRRRRHCFKTNSSTQCEKDVK